MNLIHDCERLLRRCSQNDYLEMVRRAYVSESAYVLHIVFGLAPSTDASGRYYFPESDLRAKRYATDQWRELSKMSYSKRLCALHNIHDVGHENIAAQ